MTDTDSILYKIGQAVKASGQSGGQGSTAFLGLSDTPSAYDPAKRNIRLNETGTALEFVNNNFNVDQEFRAMMSHSLRYHDRQPVVVGEEYDITNISEYHVIWNNENGFIRSFDLRQEAGVDTNFDDVFIRIDNGEPQCSNGYTYNPDNNTCVPDFGTESIDPTYPNDATFQGVYDASNALNASGSYSYTARIRVIKSGNYASAWIDTQKLLERVTALENSYAGLATYTTATLPGSAEDGALVWNSTISELVYFLNDGWYKVSDNSLVKYTIIEAYIISGQSNAGGNGQISNLSGYNQVDGTGTLADQRPFIIFSNNYNTNSIHPSTPLVNVEPALMTPGTTTTSAGLHGMEISFMDSIRDKRTALPAGMKYFINGAEIGKFDKATSDAETSNGTTNGWDGLTQSIDAMETWFNDNGYQFSWKGFIWWQGESHAGRTAAQHQALLEDLISNVRTYVSEPELPVCLVQLDFRINATDVNGTNSESTTEILQIQQAQVDIADADTYVKVIATSPYVEDMIYTDNNNDGKYEGVHWRTEAHVPIGYSTAQQMYNLIEGITEWSPAESTGIASWYDATDAQSIAESSGSVSNWGNKKQLSDFTQGNASSQPTLVADKFTGEDGVKRPAIYFNKQSANFMVNPSGLLGAVGSNFTEFSLFMVVRYPIHPQVTNAVLWGHTSTVYTTAYSHCPTMGASNCITRAGGGNSIISSNSGNFITQGTPLIIEWTFTDTGDGANAKRFLFNTNGVNNKNTPLGSGWTEWINGPFNLGSYGGAYAPTNVEVGEILACNSYVSPSERNKIEGYLAYKWGALLPSSHPYKGIHP